MDSTSFLHSVKVPQIYKSASKIVKTVFEDGGSIKQLLYTKVRKNLKGTYALITKTIENNSLLDKVITETGVLKENKQLEIWLAKVLITELLLGKGRLGGSSKPVATILNYKEDLEKAVSKFKKNETPYIPAAKPRYVRVNTLHVTTDEVIKAFRQEGWTLVPPPASYELFILLISRLTEEQFVKDFHVKDLLVFAAGTEFFRHPLYLDGTIILQDKASCIPAMILKPEPGSITLDMCSAPGMKTTMLSSLMRGKGTIYAVEVNKGRFQELDKVVQKAGCTNVTTIQHDALKLSSETHPWCTDVEYILLDPSCSGTGMTDRAHLFTRSITDEEVRKLAAFQRKLLFFALTNFPSARRVVYSTCSLQKQENEEVVDAVLKRLTSPQQWEVENIFPEWCSRGSDEYQCGPLCLTSSPDKDLTTGFFIASFRRINNENGTNTPLTKEKSNFKEKHPKEDLKIVESSDEPVSSKKRSRKKDRKEHLDADRLEGVVEPLKGKKKKPKSLVGGDCSKDPAVKEERVSERKSKKVKRAAEQEYAVDESIAGLTTEEPKKKRSKRKVSDGLP